MPRFGKCLAAALSLTGILALVGASSAAPAPASPDLRSPTALPRRAPVAAADGGTTAPVATSAVATLSAAQKAAVLKQMNDLRTTLGAASMQTLMWDDNLATFASRVAGACDLSHSTAAERTNIPGWVGTYIGENVAAGTGGITSLADATNAAKVQASLEAGVTNWWSEKPSYDYAANACASGKQCGHYTQLAWAASKSVGCALVMCAPHKTFNAPAYSMACEFGPGGNTLGKRPY